MQVMERGSAVPAILDDLEHFPSLSYDNYGVTDGGYDSDVVFLERDGIPHTVVKTLNPAVPYTHRHLLTESLVVSTLDEASQLDPAPFMQPHLIESQIQTRPYYAALSYVPGVLLSYQELADIPNENKIAIGRQLAEAVYWVEQHLTADNVPELLSRDYQPSYRMRLGFITKYIARHDEIQASGFGDVADAMYATIARTEEQFTPSYLKGSAYGHTDLHGSNMTFDARAESVALHGIFDFGGANIRPTEYEFRFFNFVSPYYTQGIIERYHELSGEELSADKMDTWSSVQVLGPVLSHICNERPFEGQYAWFLEHFLKRPDLYAI